MPKAAVREAIQTYLDPNNSAILYLGTVYPALPKVANEADLYTFVPPGSGTGAVIFMFIESMLERRIAMGGPTSGRKLRPYELGLLCVFKSVLETTAEGQAAFDDFIDSLTARIEADRNAGTGASGSGTGVVFSWGEGDVLGGPDLRFDFPVPRTADGGVAIFQAIGRVTVLEVLDT